MFKPGSTQQFSLWPECPVYQELKQLEQFGRFWLTPFIDKRQNVLYKHNFVLPTILLWRKSTPGSRTLTWGSQNFQRIKCLLRCCFKPPAVVRCCILHSESQETMFHWEALLFPLSKHQLWTKTHFLLRLHSLPRENLILTSHTFRRITPQPQGAHVLRKVIIKLSKISKD